MQTKQSKRLTPFFKPIATFKLCFALFCGYCFTLALPQTKNQWILITIAIVLNTSNTSSLQTQKAIHRVFGTVTGIALGLITFLFPSNHFTLIFFLILTALFFSWYGQRYPKYSYVSTLGIVTFCIMAMNHQGSVHLALLRTLDIFIGIAISLAVARFIFPVRSQTMIDITISQLKETIHEFNHKVFIEQQKRRNNPEFITLDSRIASLLSKTRVVIDAMHLDSKSSLPDKHKLLTTLRYLRAIYHYLMFIETAIHELYLQNNEEHHSFANAIIPFANQLNTLLNNKDLINKSISLRTEIEDFEIMTSIHCKNKKPLQCQQAIIFAMSRIEYCLNNP